MSNQHKNPTISFRISEAERKQIEARILASGMMKKDYFVRSCIYNRICVVGKKETIYPLVETIYNLYQQLLVMQTAFLDSTAAELPTTEEISALQTDYSNMLKAIIDMLDGAKYLWEGGGSHE
ncbi:plasmid mobilization protein [Lachnospiraceae bacterium LCP25S3_G4]